jgi:SAM-dependent methyltransferase
MSDSLPFEPDRFRAAAVHYRAGRRPYPPVLIRRVAEATALSERHRVLDLGCGPGNLAIGFGYFAGEIIGLAPEPEMVAAAVLAAQGLTPNVSFRQGSSYELGLKLGRFQLVTMGRSFHWMDRGQTLQSLDQMVEPGGALVLFGEAHPDSPENAWLKEWEQIITGWRTQSERCTIDNDATPHKARHWEDLRSDGNQMPGVSLPDSSG